MDIVDVKNQELAPVLQPLLREWIGVISSYADTHPDDALYWYNEQASVSTLVTAAARLGWHALAEFRAEKDEGQGRFLGRADLWIESRAATGPRSAYLIEAKQLWPRLPAAIGGLKSEVEHLLQRAMTEVASMTDSGAHRMGLVFVVPALARTYHGDDPLRIAERVKELLAALQTVEVDAWAYTGSPSLSSPLNKHGYRYPGVACLLRYQGSP